jgi:hypothetical protein
LKTAILLIATGEKYHQFIEPYLESAKKFLFPHDTILWTDSAKQYDVTQQFYKVPAGYPNETLLRYHTFLQAEPLLRNYDFLVYSDIDMRWVAPVTENEVVSNGITATLHPGYVGKVGTPERRPESQAYIATHANNKYFCGGFIGGTLDTFLWMSRHIMIHVDEDTKKGITAVWHDESHENSFLYYNCPPAKILTPSFCWPEGCQGNYCDWPESYPAKLVALTKELR